MDAIQLISFLISGTWLATVCALIGRSLAQSALLARLEPTTLRPGQPTPRVAVIVPARNERANIARCIASLLSQHYPTDCLRVVVVDDQSTDGTADVVRAMADRESRIAFLTAPPLPPGWVGKSHACWVGSRQVNDRTEWLCFIDADVWGHSDLICSAVQRALGERIDLLSLAPRHELRSFAERLMLPCGHYLLAVCQDLREERDPRSSFVAVTGQFMLICRKVYEAVGGHAAVAAAICEDASLARLVKQAGGRVRLESGERLLMTRMYTGWRSLWLGISKNLVEMLGGPRPTVLTAGASVLLAWASIAVPAIAIQASMRGVMGQVALLTALLGTTAVVALHLLGTRHFRIPIWYGLAFPLAYTVGAVMALDSIRRRRSGRVAWKGRIYP